MFGKEGIIIKTQDYSNTSKIITVFTPKGMETIMVKGAKSNKSKFTSIAQPMMHIKYDTTNGSFPILKEAECISSFNDIKSNIEATAYTTHLFEMVYKLGVEQSHETVFSFLLSLLHHIHKDPEFYGMIFELKYLYMLGIAPVFNRCVECNTEERIGFDPFKGGMVCHLHAGESTITDQDTILSMYKLYNFNLEEDIFTIAKRQIRLILDQYYEFFLNFQSKSRKILRDLYHY